MAEVQTRWYRNEKWPDTIWMLAKEKITTAYSTSWTVPTYYGIMDVGIKVYVDTTLISDGPVALVSYAVGDKEALKSATWTCPEVDVTGKYVKVQIWAWVGTAHEKLMATFRTEVFGAVKLVSADWTCYYTGSYTGVIFPTPRSSFTFHWDGDYLSRIVNFQLAPIVVVKKFVGNGLVFFEA